MWEEEKTFEQSVEKDAPQGEYTFYDGPPFATGTPHYGHLVASAIKDAVPRYWTMRGYTVKRQWGWDCHGLPIENIVEKELGISGREDIEKIGIKKFNDTCREQIFTYAHEWEKFIPRFGRWADMEHPYRTMDKDFMESEWWAFKQLYNKGLIYESYRSMHICPRCETTLSQSEVSEGYMDIKDLSVTAEFELTDEPGTYILAWTTTPWTLPGNVALAVGADIEYVTIEKKDEGAGDTVRFIVAKELVEKIFGTDGYTIVATQKGSQLVGKAYKPLFDYYAKDERLENRENGWKVYAAEFVTTEDGTGVVHIAPAFGEDDMALGKREHLPFVQHVDMTGRFRPEVTDFAGLQVKPKEDHMATDVEIVKWLAHEGKLFAKEKYEHSYPHCWRCDTPLLNYATTSWFVAVEQMKPALLKNAEPINWSPKHIKTGRWGTWLAGARDWSISRNRFWANTMPVWRCDSCDAQEVFGSIAELKERSGVEVDDLHKDAVDEVAFKCEKCDGTMHRIPDVLDTWFNSGSVPYSTLHYPFENEAEFTKRLPVDFISEGQDQCRTWFYYQHVLAGGLFDSPAFKNVIVSGIVLAEDGKKMSKRLKNYPDPWDLINTYGADATRLYMLSSPIVRAESLNFSEAGVAEVARKTLGRLVNVYEFYELYKGLASHGDSSESAHPMDKWIVARTRQLHTEITKAMDAYELDRATRGFGDFVDDLSTWYIRRSRERMKGGDVEALATTRFVLQRFAKMLAPFAPFHADWLWERVAEGPDRSGGSGGESVHLADWGAVEEYDEDILAEMATVRKLITKALDARKEAGIPVRQPLASATLAHGELELALREVVEDELNVKRVYFEPEADVDVVLDTELTEDLVEEGKLRSLIRALQDARKTAGLKAGQEVGAKVTASKEEQTLMEKYQAEIAKQTFITTMAFAEGPFAVTLG